MVAIMAEGECFNSKNPMKKRLDPSACLRFKIGEKGMKTNLARVYVSQHVSVTKSSWGVPLLHYCPLLEGDAELAIGDIRHCFGLGKREGEKVESDIRDLIRAHPEEKKYQALLFPLQ